MNGIIVENDVQKNEQIIYFTVLHVHAFSLHSQFKRILRLHEQGNRKMDRICIFCNKHIFKHFVSSLLTIYKTIFKNFIVKYTCKHYKCLVLILDVMVTNEIVFIFFILCIDKNSWAKKNVFI